MNRSLKHLLLHAFFILNSLICLAQDQTADSTNNGNEVETVTGDSFPEPDETAEVVTLPLSRLEFQLSLFVLSFGLILILLEIYLVRINKISSEDTVKFIVITIIIVSTLFLITAGYSNDQIAPAVGLLGTIAGYLLGRINSPDKNDNEKV